MLIDEFLVCTRYRGQVYGYTNYAGSLSFRWRIQMYPRYDGRKLGKGDVTAFALPLKRPNEGPTLARFCDAYSDRVYERLRAKTS